MCDGDTRSIHVLTHSFHNRRSPDLKFIANVRSRSLDPFLMRENWLSAYDFATTRASLFLGEYARADNPFAEVGRRTVSIQVTSVVRASDTSFQVQWSEQEYERGRLSGDRKSTRLNSSH